MMAFLFKGGPEDGRVMFFNSKEPKMVAFMGPKRRVARYRLATEPSSEDMGPCAGFYAFEHEVELPDHPTSQKLEAMKQKQ